MECMFNNCNAIEFFINLGNFETSLVTNMRYMFNDLRILESLDLASFSTNRVENMEYMFNNCNSLK